MRTKDQLLLEQAYQKMISSVNEDAQDAGADQKLKKSFSDIIVGAVKRGELSEGLVERNVDNVVEDLFRVVQQHVMDAEDKAYHDGIDFSDEMRSNYPE